MSLVSYECKRSERKKITNRKQKKSSQTTTRARKQQKQELQNDNETTKKNKKREYTILAHLVGDTSSSCGFPLNEGESTPARWKAGERASSGIRKDVVWAARDSDDVDELCSSTGGRDGLAAAAVAAAVDAAAATAATAAVAAAVAASDLLGRNR